jgi:hypothetical protein
MREIMQEGASDTKSRGSPNRVQPDIVLDDMTIEDLYPSMDSLDQLAWLRSLNQSRLPRVEQCGILWFYHVPKCAGTAIGLWLEDMRAAGYFDAVLPLMSLDHVVNYTGYYAQNIEPIIASPQGKLVAVHHHHRGPALYGFDEQFDAMQAKLESVGCRLFRVTFLRQPIAREISALYFNYRNGVEKRKGPKEKFFKAVLSEVALADYHNGQVRYILNNKMNEYGLEPFKFDDEYISDKVWSQALHEANSILSKFDIVGSSEQLSDGLGEVAELIGQPNALQEVSLKLVNNNSHSSLPNDQDGSLLSMVEGACIYDQKLYDKWT